MWKHLNDEAEAPGCYIYLQCDFIRNKLGKKVGVDPGLYKMQVVYSGPGVSVWSVQEFNIISGGGTRQLNSDNYEQRTRSMNTHYI
jgi:hypothetical protein